MWPGVRQAGLVKAEPGADAGPGAMGGPLSAWQLQPDVGSYAVRSIGAEGLHFHDLRHTGNHFAASSGAGLRDLMARMGHDSERATLIYQHEARGADQAITGAIDSHVQAEHGKDAQGDDDDGQAGARSGGLMPLTARRSPADLGWPPGLLRVPCSSPVLLAAACPWRDRRVQAREATA